MRDKDVDFMANQYRELNNKHEKLKAEYKDLSDNHELLVKRAGTLDSEVGRLREELRHLPKENEELCKQLRRANHSSQAILDENSRLETTVEAYKEIIHLIGTAITGKDKPNA